MARRRQTIGGDEGDDDIVDAYTQAYFKRGQQEDPRLATAIQLLGLQQSQQEAALNREEKARAQQALEAYQQGQLGAEKERVGIAKSESEANALARATEADFRAQQAARGEQLTREAGVREAEKSRSEQENKNRESKATAIWRLANQGVLKPEEAKAEWDKLYPENVEIAAGLKEQKLGEAVAQHLERYRAMTPEARKALAANPAEMLTVGGPEGYQRIMQQLGQDPNQPVAPEQGFWSKMFSGGATGAPPGPTVARPSVGEQLISPEGVRIGDIIAPRVTVDPELRSGRTRTSAEPAPDYTNLYGPGYPSAKPDYMYGVQTPVAADVINKYANDPRFTPVEDVMMKKAVDWWQGLQGAQPTPMPTPQTAAGPQWQYGTGTQPTAQAPVAVPQVPRSTAIDDLLRMAGSQSEDMPWLYGNRGWPTSQPLPGPTPLPRELLQ